MNMRGAVGFYESQRPEIQDAPGEGVMGQIVQLREGKTGSGHQPDKPELNLPETRIGGT